MDIATIFLESAIKRVSLYRDLAEKAMTQLNEEDFHFRPAPESNNIAIIIQHMSGNMISRWTNFLSEDGEKKWRSRDHQGTSLQFIDLDYHLTIFINITTIHTCRVKGHRDIAVFIDRDQSAICHFPIRFTESRQALHDHFFRSIF